MGIASESNAFRELLEFLGVAAAEQDIVGHQRVLQTDHDILHRAAPFLLPSRSNPRRPT